MLELNSNRWSELNHAYGAAANIPALLQQLQPVPAGGGDSEPWFSLWSALAHQGDVYSASFAAVPYVIAALASAPERASFDYFQFPAWVEICRSKNNVLIPQDLQRAYVEALSQMPKLVAAASSREWSADFLACALSAIAASKGYPSVAEASLELNPDVANEFMGWFFAR